MHRTNSLLELKMHISFQYVSSRPRSKRARNLSVALICRENYDAGTREFAEDAVDGLNPVEAGHLKIHQSHIGPV